MLKKITGDDTPDEEEPVSTQKSLPEKSKKKAGLQSSKGAKSFIKTAVKSGIDEQKRKVVSDIAKKVK